MLVVFTTRSWRFTLSGTIILDRLSSPEQVTNDQGPGAWQRIADLPFTAPTGFTCAVRDNELWVFAGFRDHAMVSARAREAAYLPPLGLRRLVMYI